MKSAFEDFDGLVRKHLQDADSGADGWDLPSARVWDAVAERIRPEKRRRWGFWWVLGGIALLFTCGLGVILQGDSMGRVQESPPQPKEIPQKENSASAPDIKSSLSMQLPQSSSLPAETSSQSTDSQEVEESGKGLEHKTHRTPPGAVQATNLHQTTQEDLLPGMAQVQRVEGDPLLEIPNAGFAQSTTVGMETQTTGRLKHAEAVFLQSPLTPLAWKTPNIPQHDVTPLITAGKQPGAWSVIARLSPSLGTRRITVPDAQPRVRRSLLLQQEEATIQPGFGLSLIHQMHPRWSIGLGFEYGSYVLNGNSTQQLRYTRAGERLNGRGNFENRLRLHLSTSYGELSTDVVVERSSDAQIEENRFISLALETKHSMQEIQIPLSVGYHLPVSRWKVFGYAGLSANVILENTLTFRAIQSLHHEIVHTSTARKVTLTDTRNVVMGYHLGFALEMPLKSQWSIVIGPSLSGSLMPVHENRQIRIYPVMADADIGVRYHF